jgi:hypothetical protein
MGIEQLLYLPHISKFLWEHCGLSVGNPESVSISLLTFSEYFHQKTTPKANNEQQTPKENNEQRTPQAYNKQRTPKENNEQRTTNNEQ